MSGFFGEGSGPQPPKVLRSSIEKAGIFSQLCDQNKPLTLIFRDRNQRFLTYISAVDKQGSRIALDQLVPEEGQRMLSRGEPFRIDAYLEGVHIYWKSGLFTPAISQHEGYTVAWFQFPEEMIYHQKRNAFRARTLSDEPVQITLAGTGLDAALQGQVSDLSATGCKARLEQAPPQLQLSQVLNDCRLTLPDGQISVATEIRHIKPGENNDTTTLGLRFLQLDGMSQRNIERYVNHLQREARRRQEGELF